jgi:heterodisulfide reductase subunit A-like polyferredoxin
MCLETRDLTSKDRMPAHDWEIEETEEEGTIIHGSVGPKRILVEDGKIAGVETRRCSSVYDEDGKFAPQFTGEAGPTIEGDTVIIAIGQRPDLTGFEALEKTPWGTIKTDELTLETSIPGVFAGGDIVSGPASVIEAVNHGNEVAISIDRYLNGQDVKEGRGWDPKIVSFPEERVYERVERAEILKRDPLERVRGFDEIEYGFDEETVVREASRCLACAICSECMQCVAACKAEAIDHCLQDEVLHLDVGAVVLATGFDEFDPAALGEYGYGRYPNVLSSIEFERVLSASGPYGGHVQRPSDGEAPKKIAFIQCVGSRDERCGAGYCSSVCCMYTTKEAVIAKEHTGGALDTHVYFMDMRSYGRDFDRYYERARDEYGVVYRRARISHIEEEEDTRNLKIIYEEEEGSLKEEVYDMVVLSVGLFPTEGVKELAETLGLRMNKYGFVDTDRLEPLKTSREGMYVCGVSSEPKDIPETVTQASAAAAEVLGFLSEAKGTLVEEKVYPPERDVSGEEPRIGVFVCHCGINIGGIVDVPEVMEYAKTLPGVAYAEANLYTCSQDTQERIKEVIAEENLNRVVVASCTPRTHEALFRESLREAGLNPYLFEMANIRDQCSWVHMKQPKEATEKSKDLVRMIAAKARLIQPLSRERFEVTKGALIIGGGLAGMIAALKLAEQGFDAHIVEREAELGGNLRDLHYTLEGMDPGAYLHELMATVENHEKIKVYTQAEVAEIAGFLGNFKTTIQHGSGYTEEIDHGVILVATGGREEKVTEYRYGENPGIVSQKELEALIATEPERLGDVKNVVMIQCVGSRCEERPYCSRVCCAGALKNALKIKEISPETNVFILYRDIRTYGFKEEYYRRAREEGIFFIRFDEEIENKPVVYFVDGAIEVMVTDKILQRDIIIRPDLLALSMPIVPNETEALAQLLKVPRTRDGFFLEAHVKLRPVDFATDGIFLCGLAHAPKFMDETISQASAAAGRASTILSRDYVESEGATAYVDEAYCRACEKCRETCEYGAIDMIERADGVTVAHVNPVLCKGCGACAVICPNGAMRARHFDLDQISAMVEAVMGG